MDGEELVQLRLAYPFRPFTIITTKGRRIVVNEPYHVAVSPDRAQVMCELPDGDFVTFKPSLIEAVEMHNMSGTPQASPAEVGGSATVAQ